MKFLITTLLLSAIWLPASGLCQSPSFKGQVVDQRGDGVEGAAIRCSGNNKLLTSSRGSGWFDVPDAACESGAIVITATGFVPKRVDLNSIPDNEIILEPLPIAATVEITGVSTSIADTPASVTEIDKERLDTAGAVTLDDRLRQVPGFSLFRRAGSRTANPTAQGVSLRSVGASGASRALVLKDGVPLNDPFGGWVYWGRVPSESIAEVEIVRGPAGDLYGTAAVGGVISIRSVDAHRDAARLDLSYGNERTPALSTYASLAGHPFAYSFGLEIFRTDGSIPIAPELRGVVDTVANVRRSAFTPRISRELGERRKLWIAGDFYRESRKNGTPLQTNDTRIGNLTAGADVEWQHAGTLALRIYGGSERYHQSFSAIAGDRSTESLTRLQTVPSRLLGIRGQWSGQHGHLLYYTGGETRDIHGRSDETGFAAGRQTVETSAGGREITAALFAGGLYYLTERLTLSGGIRFDNWQNVAGFSDSRSLVGTTTSHTRFADRTESRFSPRASLLFRASQHISFAGTFATGFRQPTLNELYRSFRVGNIVTLANENLRAERAWDLEAAAIVNAMDGRLYMRTGPFCTRVADPVANVTLIITPELITRQRQNLGRTRTCGWEGDVDLRPTSNVTLTGGFLVASPRVIVGTTPDLNGLLLPQVPRRTFTLQARYSRPRGLTVSTQFRSSSSQFEDDQNLLVLDGYTAVDAFASYYLGKWTTVYVAGENLLDSRIEAGRTPVLTLAQPRAFRIGIRLRLGE